MSLRVALCISGMPRSYKRVFASQRENLLEVLNPDVFVSTWRSLFTDDAFPETDSPEEMIDLYRPLRFDIEDFSLARKQTFERNPFHTNSDQAGRVVARMLPMYYKIYLASLHRIMHERENQLRYDVVLRCRSDLFFERPLEIEAPEPNTVYFPCLRNQNLVNDTFWYADPDCAERIAQLYLNIPKLWYGGTMIHGETLLWNYIQELGIRKQLVDIRYHLVR
jgi:hypothetical protein